jgi:hypothetical protein
MVRMANFHILLYLLNEHLLRLSRLRHIRVLHAVAAQAFYDLFRPVIFHFGQIFASCRPSGLVNQQARMAFIDVNF